MYQRRGAGWVRRVWRGAAARTHLARERDLGIARGEELRERGHREPLGAAGDELVVKRDEERVLEELLLDRARKVGNAADRLHTRAWLKHPPEEGGTPAHARASGPASERNTRERGGGARRARGSVGLRREWIDRSIDRGRRGGDGDDDDDAFAKCVFAAHLELDDAALGELVERFLDRLVDRVRAAGGLGRGRGVQRALGLARALSELGVDL